MNLRQTGFAIIAACTLIAAQAGSDKHAPGTAASFLQEAAQGSAAEVAMGRLAQQKAQREDIKAFGAQMVADHSKARDKAAELAAAKGIAVSDEPTPEQQQHADHLSTLSGAAFDRAYIAAMVKDHRKDVAKFEAQASQSQDSEVAAFARQTLPTLQDHLERVTAIESDMADGKMTSDAGN
jgi:putative membrane protein